MTQALEPHLSSNVAEDRIFHGHNLLIRRSKRLARMLALHGESTGAVASGLWTKLALDKTVVDHEPRDTKSRKTFLWWRRIPELVVFLLTIAVLNVSLLTGSADAGFMFVPDRVIAGEWWRVITHAFVHVSLYHLMIDVTSFLVLYVGLARRRLVSRMTLLATCAVGSLSAAMFACPDLIRAGFCGLSGIAHGLMMVWAFESIQRSAASNNREATMERIAGLVCMAVLTGKCMIEALTGNVIFAGLHFGNVGSPVAACHAGGALGGALFFMLERSSKRDTTRQCGLCLHPR